ncbi:hypothetical protein AUP68_06532 [Ilyonectria robusta]
MAKFDKSSVNNGNRLSNAPLSNLQSRLDVGAGNRDWACDAVDHHPEAKAIAFDRLDVLPEWVPPNLTCQIDNADRGRTLCQDMTERTGRALEMTETIRDLLRTAGFRRKYQFQLKGTFHRCSGELPLTDSRHHHLDSFQHPEQLVRQLTAASVTHVTAGLVRQTRRIEQ